MKMSMVNSQPPMAMHSKRPERQKTSWIDGERFQRGGEPQGDVDLILIFTLPETNSFAPENRPGPKRKLIFLTIHFHGPC